MTNIKWISFIDNSSFKCLSNSGGTSDSSNSDSSNNDSSKSDSSNSEHFFIKNNFYILTTEEIFEGQRFAILAMFI